MSVKRIDTLLERLKSLKDDRVRVIFADGGTTDVTPGDAIPLVFGDRPVVRVEALGSMVGHGYMLDLLNLCCEL